MQIHTVGQGDNLFDLINEFGMSYVWEARKNVEKSC